MSESPPTLVSLSALDVQALSDRLRALAGEERNVQADFLLHLDALDRRRGYVELGFPSLWEYCLRALHLREGAAGRRIGAMRVLRRLPSLIEALRDGRLSLSTLCVLGPALTPDNVDDLVARAALRTKAETDAIAASVRPRVAPADGLRRLSSPSVCVPGKPFLPIADVNAERSTNQELLAPAMELPSSTPDRKPAPDEGRRPECPTARGEPVAPPPDVAPAIVSIALASPASRLDARPPPKPTAELRAVAEAEWSLRVTLDAEAKHDLETLTALLGHKIPCGSLAEVVKEALRCAIEKHGVRRGALASARARKALNTIAIDGRGAREGDDASAKEGSASPRSSVFGFATRPTIPAEVRRQVWTRDAGRCSFTAPDGTRCGSRWKLELDHVVPWALGGSPSVDNLRLRCRAHNLLHAARTFGREHMERFRRDSGGISAH